MTTPTIAPYGSWQSPITTDLLLGGSIFLDAPRCDGDDVYWIEVRPLERGRSVIVRLTPDGRREDVTPPDFNARTRAHEYGGGDYTVHDGVVYFANYSDQRIYRQRPGEAPEPLTPEAELRYADLIVDARRNRLICVREDHRTGGEPANTLVAIPLDGGEQAVLAEGHDFYATPRLSPDSRALVWLTWDHPNMPWDGTELWLAEIPADGTLAAPRVVAGSRQESIFQPEWSPDGRLYFVSERTGWWNLYRLGNGRDVPAERLYPMEAEFGLPQWVFGMSTYAFVDAGTILCTYTSGGQRHMARLDLRRDAPAERLYRLDVPLRGAAVASCGNGVLYVGASPTEADAVIRLAPSGDYEVLQRSAEFDMDAGYISVAEPVEFPTANGLTAHGYFYAPRNRDWAAPEGELPPLIVTSHGGPTSATDDDLSLARQFWTSRGFAILDVNYGGSTGYGRAYRERLKDNWGVVDVEDCINGARWLVDQGRVDGDRLIIRGGSAGGYTTLCAITFHDTFKAAASYYGVSDAEALARDTHKFESRYTDGLIGPYPAARDVYVARSPIHVADKCSAALILFQGLEDKVVPPDQSEAMFVAARNKELPVAYLSFAGEGHGFRQAATLKRTMESELYFYSRVFGFDLAEAVEPVEIENL